MADLAETLDRGAAQCGIRGRDAGLENADTRPVPLLRERAGRVAALVRILVLQSLAEHAERELAQGGEPFGGVEPVACPERFDGLADVAVHGRARDGLTGCGARHGRHAPGQRSTHREEDKGGDPAGRPPAYDDPGHDSLRFYGIHFARA